MRSNIARHRAGAVRLTRRAARSAGSLAPPPSSESSSPPAAASMRGRRGAARSGRGAGTARPCGRAARAGGRRAPATRARPPRSTSSWRRRPSWRRSAKAGGGVVEHVDRALDDDQVAAGVHVGEGAPGALRVVVDVHVLVEDDERLGVRHLPRAPQAVHELLGVAGELLPDGDEAEVVEHALRREGHVDHLGEDQSAGAAGRAARWPCPARGPPSAAGPRRSPGRRRRRGA